MHPARPPLSATASLLAALVLIEYLLVRRRGGGWDWRESLASLAVAAGHHAALVLSGAGVALLYAQVWAHRLLTLPLDGAWTMFALLLGTEFCYYWQHRTSHASRWFWASHAVHHSPRHLNLSAAYRLGWTATLSGAPLFYLPLVWLGFHPAAVLGALGLSLLYQTWLHTETIPRLGWFEWVFNTPSHHRVHHACNPAYLDANFGGVLILFDRLFGTFVAARDDEPCRYGLVQPLDSYNPLVIALHGWIALARDLRRARGWRQRMRTLFGPPGLPANATHHQGQAPHVPAIPALSGPTRPRKEPS